MAINNMVVISTAKKNKMKKYTQKFQMNSDAPTTNVPTGNAPTATTAKAQPTSPELEALRADYRSKMAAMASEQDFDKQQTMMLDAFNAKKAVDAEIANIQRNEIAKQNAEKINQRISLVDSLVSDAQALALINADKKSTEDDRAAASDKLAASYDVVKTELLARYATSKPTASVTGEKKEGGTGAAILEQHKANLASGMTSTESKKAIVDSGASKGTTGAVVLAWEREQGLK